MTRPAAWLVSGLLAGGCAVAVANSPQTHNQPIFSPGPASVPPDHGGEVQGPPQMLGLPDSAMPKVQGPTQTTQLPPAAQPAGLSGFAACWWQYHHGLRSKPC